MSTRSITPRTSCSRPIGISVATTCGPNAPFSCSSVRKKSARSRSSMVTQIMRARSSSAARAHRRVVPTSTPRTALTQKIADSHTRRAPSASATKLGSPGVSRRLILRSSQVNDRSDALIDIRRACSSASVSAAVVPSAIVPRRGSRRLRTGGPRSARSFRYRGGRQGRRCGCGPRRGAWPAPLLRGCEDDPNLADGCVANATMHRRTVPCAQSRGSEDNRERRRSTALVWSCEIRDSVTPSTSPISRSVRFS